MKQITETSFQQGYFKIPRTLLKQQTGSGQLENMGAFFQVLSHANYSETTYNIHGLTIFCQRGESLISNLHWSILFGWTRIRPPVSSKGWNAKASSRSSPTRRRLSISASSTTTYGLEVHSLPTPLRKRKNHPKLSTPFGTTTIRSCGSPKSTSPVPATNGRSSRKKNGNLPSTVSKMSTTTPTTPASSPTLPLT